MQDSGRSLFWGVGTALVWIMIIAFLLAFIGVVDVYPVAPDALFVEESMNEEAIIYFDTTKEIQKWFSINDDVMGGLSTSQIHLTEQGTAIFTGTLSLENNGGFASVRTPVYGHPLDRSEGLAIRVKGDGHRYKLRIHTDDRWDGIAYSADFTTVDGEWMTVHVPFDKFIPTFRGWRVPDAPAITAGMVRQIGLMIADKQTGPFRLEIDSIVAYQTTQPSKDQL